MFRRFFLLLGSLGIYLIPLCLGVAGVLCWYYIYFQSPRDSKSQEKFYFEVQKGWDLDKIASTLEEKGLVRSQWSVRMLYKGLANKSQNKNGNVIRIIAGEYELSPAMKPAEILDVLTSGKLHGRTLEIPAGGTIRTTAKLIAEASLATESEARAALRDPQTMVRLQIPAFIPEGYIVAGIYSFFKPITAQEVVYKLIEQSQMELDRKHPNWKIRAVELGHPPYDVLIIASIIEKEALNPEERSKISAVIHNRLRLGLNLQLDSVLSYGMQPLDGEELDIAVSLDQTRVPGAYNTYLNHGLPPTPICSPSHESIEAALSPEDSDLLYIVRRSSRNDFAANFKEYRSTVRQAMLEEVSAKNLFEKPIPVAGGTEEE